MIMLPQDFHLIMQQILWCNISSQIILLCLLKTLHPSTRIYFFVPLNTVTSPNCLATFQLFWCSFSPQCVTCYCHQHTEMFYTACHILHCLLCMCNMDCYWIQGILTFLYTPFIHAVLSALLGIVPLLSFPYVNIFVLQIHLTHDVHKVTP